jgi:hypothetical protein
MTNQIGEEPLPTPDFHGCLWPVDEGCLGDEWAELDESLQTRALALASATLHRLTGYRVGGCPVTVRPCSGGCITQMTPDFWHRGYGGPYIRTDGEWVNACGHHDCTCSVACEITLPGPVGAIYEVKVDGEIVDPTDYRLDGNRLVWLGADCGWPVQQDITLPDTDDGTFSVRYLNSYPVDGNGAYAVAVLAMEYAKACAGKKCRLPSGVTQVSRQGVSFEIPSGAFPDGLTGIREVDAFIALWNPNGLRQAVGVLNISQRRNRVVG